MIFFFRLVAFGCVVLLTICGLLGAYVMVYLREPGPLTAAKEVQIPAGASSGKIASILGEAGVVKYPDLFSISVRIAGTSKNFQAGEYVFPPGVSVSEVVHKMLTGDVIRRAFTIPEGRTSVEVAEMLRQNQLLSGDVEVPPEGSLLPETYDYRKGESREALIVRMRKALDDVFNEAWAHKDSNLPVNDRNQALTLASVIEKETGKASERPMVASVFVNRLRVGMRLQSDPTVIYGVTDGAGDLGRPISRKDLQFNSPYNTYVIDGLPPAPICNPGKESIRAALHPARSDALFFVADGTGAHRFAATLEQHNANVQVLRAWEAKRRGEVPPAPSPSPNVDAKILAVSPEVDAKPAAAPTVSPGADVKTPAVSPEAEVKPAAAPTGSPGADGKPAAVPAISSGNDAKPAAVPAISSGNDANPLADPSGSDPKPAAVPAVSPEVGAKPVAPSSGASDVLGIPSEYPLSQEPDGPEPSHP